MTTPSLSPLSPLRNPVFRSIWLANLASNLGTQIQTVAAAWAMATISTSPGMVAFVQTSSTLPIMLFSLIAGAMADNFDRRRIMLIGQGLMVATAAILALFGFIGFLTPWLLLAFTFVLGLASALHNPSWQSSVGDIVPRAELPAAIMLNGMGANLARSVGPALGGLIVSGLGVATAFTINAVSVTALIGALFRWRHKPPPNPLPRETLGLAISSGLRYVLMSPNIQKALLRAFAFGFVSIATIALLPLVARDLLHGDATLYGLLFGSFGLGAVGGAFLGHWLRQRLTTEWCARVAFAGFVICHAVMAVSPSPWLTALASAVGGSCWVMGYSLFNITIQQISPRWVVGRTLSFYQTATYAGLALGSWSWGIAADRGGPQTALLLAAAATLAGAALGLKWFGMPEEKDFNLDPLDRWREPQLALDIKPRSGPVKIIIEYKIREADIAEFLAIMAERRRIRMRDGARHWSLLRDLKAPEIWLETYNAPTWLEYVRQSQRVTHADRTVSDRLRQLHQGETPPVVRHLIERVTDSAHQQIMAGTPGASTAAPH